MKWDAKNFGFNTREIYRPSEEAYLTHHANNIIKLMDNNSIIHAKTIAKQRYLQNGSGKINWNRLLNLYVKLRN